MCTDYDGLRNTLTTALAVTPQSAWSIIYTDTISRKVKRGLRRTHLVKSIDVPIMGSWDVVN